MKDSERRRGLYEGWIKECFGNHERIRLIMSNFKKENKRDRMGIENNKYEKNEIRRKRSRKRE